MGRDRIESADSGDKNGTGKREGGTGESPQGNDAPTGTEKDAGTGTEKGSATGTAAKRKPSTIGPSDNPVVNPAAISQDNFERDDNGEIVIGANGKPKKKRGRKPGQKVAVNTAKPVKEKFNGVEMLAAQFQILNVGISYMTRFDDFRLDDQEANDLANATAQVMVQFNYTPDPKFTAVMGLVTTVGIIYGPRVYLYKKELTKSSDSKMEKKIARADEKAANNSSFDQPYNLGQFSG